LAEEAIRDNLKSLKESQRIARLGSWYLDVATNEVTWTDELYRMYDFDPKLPPPPLPEQMKLFSAESWTCLTSAITRAAEEGSSYKLELETVRDDGRCGWMLAIGEAVRDSNGVIVGLKGTAQDISDSKQVELELKEARESLIEAQKIAVVGSWSMDPNSKILTWSPELYNILEIDHNEEPSVELYYSRVHPDDLAHVQDLGSRIRQDEDKNTTEYRLLTPSGVSKSISSTSHVTLNEAKEVIRITGIVQDITERKKVEDDRILFEKQILQTQKLESLGVLAGGIAHDFNNILMGILGYADLALSEISTVSPAREFLLGINDSSKKAAELVKQMLAYSGKGKFSLEPIDLNQVIEETVQMLNVSISKNAVLRFNYSPTPVFLEGDPSQIRQIIMNLTINASEAIEKKSGVIALSTGSMYCDREYIETTGFESQLTMKGQLPEGMYVFLEVSDTGVGMSDTTISKVFEPFFTTKFTGRGLGLSAILGITRGHRGMVRIYSEEGKGTTFKVLFPIFDDETSSQSKDILAEGIDDDWSGQGVFLITDDEETVRTVAKHMIQKLGFKVITADDGREAIKIFDKHSDDIVGVLLDLTMPHKDGTEVFNHIHKLKPDTKVILSSGYNEQDATQQFIGKGLAGFIQKPYTAKELGKVIIEIMSKA